MAAWSNPGSGRSVTTSSAHIRPCASAMATRTGLGATAAAITRACCSSTERTACLSAVECGPGTRLLFGQAQSFDQPAPQVWAIVVTIQCKVNRSFEVASGISQVVSRAAVHDDVYRMALLDQQRDRVGQLDLTAAAHRRSPGPEHNDPRPRTATERPLTWAFPPSP